MSPKRFAQGALTGAAALAVSVTASLAFERVDSRDTFVDLVNGRTLTTLGVRLQVSPTGEIRGRAFGQNVTGAWEWQNGYFCRRMQAGNTEVPMNCQLVELNGATLRFTSDRGAGDNARLTLR